MNIPDQAATSILIATDRVTDALLVKNLLYSEFDNVFISTDPDKVPGDFVRYRPGVLILAFDSLEKSESYYLELKRRCQEVHRHPHRSVILCQKDEVSLVYELCKKDYFDDYILFWPINDDSSRLLMFIHHALHELAALKNGEPSTAEFAAQAHQLEALKKTLDHHITQGSLQIEVASRAINQATLAFREALDGFSLLQVPGALPDREGLNYFKHEEIEQHFSAINDLTQPMKQWAQEFRLKCEPFVESARVLNAMAERVRPTVLVVDDEEPQRKLLGQLLKNENYHLIFANDGLEALNVLRKTQPDIILMDMMMPDMNGLEAMQRLKSMPQFFRTPVIMITGKSEGEFVVDCMKAGAVDFVVKPYVHATLKAKIARALKAGNG